MNPYLKVVAIMKGMPVATSALVVLALVVIAVMLKDRIDLLITWTLTIVVAAVIFVIVHATRSHSTEK